MINMFISNDNKALLWNVLQKNKKFDGVDNKAFPIIVKEFEKQLDECLHSNSFSSMNLIDQNKYFLNKFDRFLSNYKIKNTISNKIENKIVSDESKQNIFEQRLREKQKEFENLINNPKPPTIDFSDEAKNNTQDISNNISERYYDNNNEAKISQNIQILEEKIANQDKVIILLTKQLEEVKNKLNSLIDNKFDKNVTDNNIL